MSIADPTDRETVARALANTYAGDRPGWERVQEYNEVLDYAARNPDAGSTAIAGALDLPRGRVRPWLDGSRPDPVRGIQTAADHGWLDLAWDGPTLRALTVAVAWVFSGGSINEWYVPAFAVEESTRQLAEVCFDVLGIGHGKRHADSDRRATEIVPARDTSVLGRLLHALGAPVGSKGEMRLSLPDWLDNAPPDLRLTFARMYVSNRGIARPDRQNRPVALREERGRSYRRELRALFESIVDGEAVRGDSPTLYLTEAGATKLDQLPGLSR